MNNKKLVKIIITLAFVGATGLFFCLSSGEGKKEIILQKQNVTAAKMVAGQGESKKSRQTAVKKETKIYVHICGRVKHPDVYELPDSARVADAIRQAGGLKKDAADDAVNQARLLKDGEQIYIPSKKEAVKNNTAKGTKKSGSSSGQGSDGKININNATKEQLVTLPGIGEAKAEKIIGYREKNGGFKKVEEIMKIQGIKNGVYGKIKELITV